MRKTLRKFLPLTIAVAMVAGLGAAPVAAQSDEPVTTAAVEGNADQVDYKDAVGAKASRQERAKNLVATNREGRLPSNILEPLWKLMKGIPAVLADGQISWAELVAIPADLADGKIGWAEVANKPADFADGQIGWAEIVNKPADLGQVAWGDVTNKPTGFADNVDDGGFVSQVIGTFNGPWGGGNTVHVELDISRNADVDCYALPVSGTAFWQVNEKNSYASNIAGNVFWYIIFRTPNGGTGEVKIRCRTYSEGIAPAALNQALSHAKVTVQKGKKSR